MAETRPDITLVASTLKTPMKILIAYYTNRAHEYKGMKKWVALLTAAQLSKTLKGLQQEYHLVAKGNE